MKNPSSLKAQQITSSLSPPSAELLHSLILFHPSLVPHPTPGLFGGGTLPFPSQSSVVPAGF